MGESAFEGCTRLKSVNILGEITMLSNSVFAKCVSLTQIQLPKSISKIDAHAFAECENLSSIKIPDNVVQIGNYAFWGCSKIRKIQIPASVEDIRESVFLACKALEHIEVSAKNGYYTSENGILYDYGKTRLISCPEGKKGTIEIPDGVMEIADYAFFNCTKITGIEFPKSLNRIGMESFTQCSGLKTVSIPEGVTELGDSVFSGCSNLQCVELPNSVLVIQEYAFAGCNSLKSIDIPKAVTVVSGGMFLGCTSLTSVKLPDHLESIGHDAFADCSALRKIELPDSVRMIESFAFARCSKLENFVVPNGLTELSHRVFDECTGLKSVKIPASVMVIDSSNFENCPNVKIYCKKNSTAHQYAVSNGLRYEIVKPVRITTATIAHSAYTYDGSEKRPVVTVKAGTKKLVNGTDYIVTYKNNQNPGTATVVITGTGDYIGSITKKFKINLSKVMSFKQSANYATSKITMSWNKVKGASGYVVYRATSKNGTYKYLKTVTTNSCSHAGLKAGSKYYYKVRAYKTVNGKKVYGFYSDAKSMLTKTAAPAKLTVMAGMKLAKISWEKVTSANGYEVYMSTSRNGIYQEIKNVGATTTAYTKTGLKKGQKYYFKVRTYIKTGTGQKVYSGYSSIKAVTVK